MSEAEDHGMGERRSLEQGALGLFEYRLKQLEDARLIHRMQSAETTISQVQAEIKSITEITRGFSGKLDTAVKQLGEKQDAEYTSLHEAQIKFMSFVRAGLWICGAIGSLFGLLVAFAQPLSKVFMALAETPGAGG